MRDIGEAFAALVRSTNALHERFETDQTVDEALECFNEEVHEFEAEAFSFSLMGYSLAEEAIDVIVTVLGVLRAVGIGDGELADMMLAVAGKNNAKTHDTHYVRDDGKIARRTS